MDDNICQNCGRPMSEHTDGMVGQFWEPTKDQAPITQATQWEDINPHGGTWIDNPVSRVLKFFSQNGSNAEDGWRFLEGWSQQERVAMVKRWIKSTWPTPWAAKQTLPEAEEEFGILFIAWALGWNLTFSGKKLQACWHQSGGYRWNPFTRQCEKIPASAFRR